VKTCTVRFDPGGVEVRVAQGETVLAAAQAAGIYVNSICGGDGLCGKCRVILREGEVSSRPTALLERDEIRQGYILACESRVLGNLHLEVPPESRLAQQPALAQEIALRFGRVVPFRPEGRPYAFDPFTRKLFLPLPPPSLDDAVGDLERVYRGITSHVAVPAMQTGLFNLRRLAGMLRDSGWRLTATLGQRGKTMEVVQLEAGDTSARNFGVALDVGTTTVVANLVDLASGEVASRKGTYNSQIRYGEDVITRIVYAGSEPAAAERLRACVVRDTNDLVSAMVQESGIALGDVTGIVAAGNTTMIHLLLGLEVANIRREPYIPAATAVPVVRAAEVGVAISGRGLFCCLPGAGPYVGSDITADVISSGMNQSAELSLLFDLGTNGEVVLGTADWLVCCSASAGPAFEGGGLKCGTRAADGAIERVAVTPYGTLTYKVIGSGKPGGICGSGLIDLTAELFRVGTLDKAGRFRRDGGVPGLRDGEDGPEFVVVPAERTATGRDITVNEDDLAIFIRSKGAIYTAADTMLSHLGFSFADVQRVYLSGGFGTSVDIGNAVVIGLLPDLPRERFQFIGNGSLAGARMCLISREALAEAEAAAARMTYLELSTDSRFMRDFTSSLFLPHTDIERFPTVLRSLGKSAP